MKSYKQLAELQRIKIKLLEDFILEAARLNDLYSWHAEPEDMVNLNKLSEQLDNITEQITKINK